MALYIHSMHVSRSVAQAVSLNRYKVCVVRSVTPMRGGETAKIPLPNPSCRYKEKINMRAPGSHCLASDWLYF